jgi:hypothetical protein
MIHHVCTSFLICGKLREKEFSQIAFFLNIFYSLENEGLFMWLFEITQLQTKMCFAWR